MNGARTTPVVLWLLTLGVMVTVFILDLRVNTVVGVPVVDLQELAIPLMIIAFSTTGLFIALRRPGHLMARIYLLSGLLGSLYLLSRVYSLAAKVEGWPGYVYGRLGDQFFYFPWILSMVALPLMLFPDGRLPSPKWRWLRWVGALLVGSLLAAPVIFPTLPDNNVGDVRLIGSDAVAEVEGGVVVTTGDGVRAIESEVTTTPAGDLFFTDDDDLFVTEPNPAVLTSEGELSNPAAVDALASPHLQPIWFPLFMTTLVVSLAAAPAALIVRFRRSSGIERLQLKWLVFPAAVAGVGLTLTYTVGEVTGLFNTWWLQSIVTISLLAVLMIPVATGLAIVR